MSPSSSDDILIASVKFDASTYDKKGAEKTVINELRLLCNNMRHGNTEKRH